jgi:hypothetical protein
MTNPTTQISETLSSIESIKLYLAGLVRAAYDGRGVVINTALLEIVLPDL